MSNHCVLLVEDNPQDELLTLRALRKAGLSKPVEVVRDGQQALDFLFGQGEFAERADEPLPLVILLDLKLPRLSGVEVLQQLRANERTRLLPVVILTSSDDSQDRLRCYQVGANSFVRKPVDCAEFAETIARLGTYWVATNEPAEAEAATCR